MEMTQKRTALLEGIIRGVLPRTHVFVVGDIVTRPEFIHPVDRSVDFPSVVYLTKLYNSP